MAKNNIHLGLSDLIRQVQYALPDWLTITISSIEGTEGSEHFHIKLNEIFIPLDYSEPSTKVNDLIDHLHCYVRYESGATVFDPAKAFTNKDYFKLEPFVLHEILSNLADTPVTIFISKSEWFVDILNCGFFYPLKNVSASEFLDYINDLWFEIGW
jgi:hypothetical protein